MALYGAIDVGSNSVRSLVVCDASPIMRYVESSSEITRITQGLKEGTKHLCPEAVERTCEALRSIMEYFEAREIPRGNCVFFATESLRSAVNAQEVVQRLESVAAMPLEIFSGEEEASCTALGASLAFPEAEGFFDLGGGSLEIIGLNQKMSRPFGAVRMYNLFDEDLQALRSYLKDKLQVFPRDLQHLVGVGGTSSAVAMMACSVEVLAYAPQKVHGYEISREVLDDFINRLALLSMEERSSIPGLPAKRKDIIVTGLVIIQELLEYLGLSSYIHSECDLLWGALRKKLQDLGVVATQATF